MSNVKTSAKNVDFGSGPVWKCVLAQAAPLIVAQFVQMLYNVVDRIYIGHMGANSSLALTGVGLVFPMITFILAFTALFGMGGVPLFSMARGGGNDDRAAKILGNSTALLLAGSVVLTAVGYIFKRPILFAFGASENSIGFALEYLNIYLAGTVFSMLSTGLNGYINAQGFPRTGMLSVVIGAVCNIILDPIFIFVFDMGVGGAALATVISQAASAWWVLHFLTGSKSVIPLSRKNIRLEKPIVSDICRLGTSNFIMKATNFFVQVACNTTLQNYGGDLYVGIMTVVNSVRDVVMLPVSGIGTGAQPVISFNYGAKKYKRAKSAMDFLAILGASYTLLAWTLIVVFPRFWFGVFTSDAAIIEAGVSSMKIYFFGFVFMAFQFAGQMSFQAVGDAKHAIFFSMLRKVIIVVPLTLLLPAVGLGVSGVFLAEPISNVIGGLASYITMRLTIYRKIQNNIKELRS